MLGSGAPVSVLWSQQKRRTTRRIGDCFAIVPDSAIAGLTDLVGAREPSSALPSSAAVRPVSRSATGCSKKGQPFRDPGSWRRRGEGGGTRRSWYHLSGMTCRRAWRSRATRTARAAMR